MFARYLKTPAARAAFAVVVVLAMSTSLALTTAAQKTTKLAPKPPTASQPSSATPAAAAKPSSPVDDYSGMYSFLQEGEFVQLDFQDDRVLGFISRYGTLDSDRGAFLDHFIKSGSVKGKDVAFTTAAVHGMWFDFKGRVERGEGKTRAAEAYYVVRGTLTEYTTDASKKTSARSREVTLKSFPQDADEETPAKPKN
jgi:hypothetical protein